MGGDIMNRTKINQKANHMLLKKYENKSHICEIKLDGCLNTWMLQWVHRHKRKWYYDKPEELLWDNKQVLLGCANCHDRLEKNKKLTVDVFLKLRGKEELKNEKHISTNV